MVLSAKIPYAPVLFLTEAASSLPDVRQNCQRVTPSFQLQSDIVSTLINFQGRRGFFRIKNGLNSALIEFNRQSSAIDTDISPCQHPGFAHSSKSKLPVQIIRKKWSLLNKKGKFMANKF